MVWMCFTFVYDLLVIKLIGPVPREATRLRLYNEELGVEAHLSASVCDYGNIELYRYISSCSFLKDFEVFVQVVTIESVMYQ